MARRSPEGAEAPVATDDTATATDGTTDAATPATDAAGTTEGTAAPAAEAKPEKVPVDLTAFNAAVETAVAERDTSTGEVPTAAIEPVQAAYRDLDGIAAKNAGKKALTEKMRDAMNAMDIQLARAYMVLSDNLSSGGGGGAKTERAPADPVEAYVQKVVALTLAQELVEVPEGHTAEELSERVAKLHAEATAQVEGYRTFLADANEDKKEPDGMLPVVRQAFKAASGKALGRGVARTSAPYTGERRDIGKHILNAFADVEPGTFLTVAEIRAKRSDEYGDNPPSAGAISARLFPKSGKFTLEGIQPGQNEKSNKGATKL